MATPNSLFAIFHVSNPALVEQRLQQIAPWLSLEVEPGQWVLVAPLGTTTKEVSERIGIDTGISNGIVLRFDSYFGVTQPSIWEWLASKQGANLGTTTSA